jgi:2-C-methyl-D-erythritol 4-phosphate cytidylyltransferase
MAANGHPTVAAVLVAAGDGRRLGADVPKAFCTLRGRTLLEHAFCAFSDHPAVRDIVVVAPQTELVRAAGMAREATVVGGAATRQGSVSRGLEALADDVEFVLVHDVARPFVPVTVIDRVLDALENGADAVIPGRPVTDTVKQVDSSGTVVATVDRTKLWAVQTPQGFRREVLVAAHRFAPDGAATDDAGLVEARGGRVVVVDGADEAFKITRPWDLAVAEAIAPFRSWL